MKSILSVLLACAILLTPALTSSASAHDYDHVYTDVNILTPDSFEELFSDIEVDRAAYSYDMIDINSSQAVVAMDIELKVGHDYYNTVVSGTVKAYTLPSGCKLYEGPLDGRVSIGEQEYKMIAGFSKIESDDSGFVSITIQDESNIVALSFGENIIQGEVAEFLLTRAGDANQVNSNSETNNLSSDGFVTNPGGAISTNSLEPPPGFFPITPSEPERPNIGEYGTYVYQGNAFHMWNSNYPGSQSLIYWDETRNYMMVFVKPFAYHTQEFYQTLHYDVAITALDSLEISLSLNPEAESSKSAHISGTYIPQDISTNILGDEYISNIYFRALIEALLGEAGVDLNLIEDILQDIDGNVTYSTSNDFFYNVRVNVGVNAHLFDELSPGYPVRFDLLKNNHTYYVGGTEYSVHTKVRYFVTGYINNLVQEDQVFYTYVDSETSQTTYTITLL